MGLRASWVLLHSPKDPSCVNSCALAFLLPALHSTTEQYCQAFLVPKCWWHTMVAPFSNQHFYSSAIQQRTG